jgi:hypothetical protein
MAALLIRTMASLALTMAGLAELSMDGVEWSEGQLHSTPVESWLEWSNSGVHGWSSVESSGIDLLRCKNHRSNRGA